MDGGAESAIELPLFTSSAEAYVYAGPRISMSASTHGHRAESWDLNKWDAEVAVRVVEAGDGCWVRLLGAEGEHKGALFAEAPVRPPPAASVEPVIDSSRYFVLRVEDRDSGRHAFLGLGFRERGDASDFAAALAEHEARRRRAGEAAAMRAERAAAAAAGGAAAGGGGGVDMSLKGSVTLSLPLPARPASGRALSKSPSLFFSKDGGVVASLRENSGPLLPPPPAAAGRPGLRVSQDGKPAPAAGAGEGGEDGWGEFVG